MTVQMHDEGGFEALLYHLLHEVDVRDFNVRAVPKTAALLEQIIQSLSSNEAWLYDVLQRGQLPQMVEDGKCSRMTCTGATSSGSKPSTHPQVNGDDARHVPRWHLRVEADETPRERR